MSEYLEIGSKAPDFEAKNAKGQVVKLSDYLGKKVVLYFYPKDNTPGCTNQACDFRDNSEDFSNKNAVIIGVSKDSIDSHTRFIDKYKLPFELLSDEDLTLHKLYGTWQMKNSFGNKKMGTVRTTYLIDEEGIIVKRYKVTRVKDHVKKVLEDL